MLGSYSVKQYNLDFALQPKSFSIRLVPSLEITAALQLSSAAIKLYSNYIVGNRL